MGHNTLARSRNYNQHGRIVDAEAVADYQAAATEVGGVILRGATEAGRKYRTLSGRHMAEVPEGKAFVRYEVPKGGDTSEFMAAVHARQDARSAQTAESFARTLDDIKALPEK